VALLTLVRPTGLVQAQVRLTLEGHQKTVELVALSPDKRWAASASRDSLRVWDLTTGKEKWAVATDHLPVYSLAIAPDNKTLFTTHASPQTRSLCRRNLATGEKTGDAPLREGRAFGFSPDARWLALSPRAEPEGQAGHSLLLLDAATGKVHTAFRGHTAPVVVVAFAADGGSLAAGSRDGRVKVWDLKTDKEVFAFQPHKEEINGLGLSRDGKWLATSSGERFMKIWDARTGLLRATPFTKGNPLLFTPGGKTLVLPGDTGPHLLNAVSGQTHVLLKGHPRISSLAISGDGRLALTGSADKTVKLWDLPAD
jgi:WD40 repeat protein